MAARNKVQGIPDPELDKPGSEFRHAVTAEVKRKDGRVFSERVDTVKGSNKNTMTKE